MVVRPMEKNKAGTKDGGNRTKQNSSKITFLVLSQNAGSILLLQKPHQEDPCSKFFIF